MPGSAITTIEREALLLVRHLTLTAVRRTRVTIDRSAYTLLACLDDGREMSLGELSEVLGLDVSTISRQTTAMLRSGLLERIGDPAGGAARKLRATQAGEQSLRDACAQNIDLLRHVTESWEPEDLAAFARYLERFNGAFEELESRPWPGRSRTEG